MPENRNVPIFGRPAYEYEELDSTMDRAHELAREGAPEGALVVAGRQTKGRGRQGRPWVSPQGGAYCSLILRPTRPVPELPQLSLVAGLAAAEAIRDTSGVLVSIKWPNDLLLDGKKLAGILVEAKSDSSTQHTAHSTQTWVVIGVGINVSTDPSALPPEATSLAAAGASPCDRDHLIAVFCRRLSYWYDVWSREGVASIRDPLRSWMAHAETPIL